MTAVVFAITTVGFAFWITREHNALAASASEQMIRGGMTALDEKLKTVAMDFAIWPDAVRAVREADAEWIWENVGISAAVTETTDMMMIAPADGTPPYGWVPGMEAEPSTTLLPKAVIDKMLALIAEVPIAERRAVSALTATNDATWMLAAARIVSDDPAEDPADDSRVARLIFGFKLTLEMMQEVGEQYLISDLSISKDVAPGRGAFPLIGADGNIIANAVWTPPRPGDQILRSIAVPMAFALAILTLMALVSSSVLTRSARRLEAAMVTAQQASRAKSDFIANISHELRTPMNGVIGLGGLLRQTGLNDKQASMLDMLLASAENQMRLIGDLLDVNSIESGRFNLSLAPFSPAAVVESTCALFAIEAAKKGLDLECRIPDADQTSVLGDRERFRQICDNLISNAIKFTDRGKVIVDLKVRPRLGEAQVSLSVADTGRGIDRPDLKRIFERFAQSATPELGKAAGNGLGLSITKTIVDLMGGTIDVESSLGKGSVFRVEIGLEETNSAAVPVRKAV